ncbi:MAG: hypothetical protein DRJ69_04500, partial [Thermoprotei archaeon]
MGGNCVELNEGLGPGESKTLSLALDIPLNSSSKVYVVSSRGRMFEAEYLGLYVREVVIENPAGNGDLEGVQVRLTLRPSFFDYSKARVDGGDLRFYLDTEAEQRVPHWIERWDPDGESVVWIRVPRIRED